MKPTVNCMACIAALPAGFACDKATRRGGAWHYVACNVVDHFVMCEVAASGWIPMQGTRRVRPEKVVRIVAPSEDPP